MCNEDFSTSHDDLLRVVGDFIQSPSRALRNECGAFRMISEVTRSHGLELQLLASAPEVALVAVAGSESLEEGFLPC